MPDSAAEGRGHWTDRYMNKPHAYADLSDEDMANRVRMMYRDDLEFECVCIGARDRIAKLARSNHDLTAALVRLGKTLQGPIDDVGPDPELIEEYYAAMDAVKALAADLAAAGRGT